MNMSKYRGAGICLLLSSSLLTACASISTNPSVSDTKTQSQAAIEAPTIPVEAQKHQAALTAVTDFNIAGRMGIQSEGYGVSGTIHWKHSNENDAIDLYSPLGTKIAAIVKTTDGVSLTTKDGKIIKAQDAETLTARTLGWKLPLSKLPDWIVGRPASGVVTSFAWDENGKLSKLSQDGWEISYMQYQTDIQPSLPNKLNLRNPKMNVRIIVESWDTSPQTSFENNTAQLP